MRKDHALLVLVNLEESIFDKLCAVYQGGRSRVFREADGESNVLYFVLKQVNLVHEQDNGRLLEVAIVDDFVEDANRLQ